MHIEHFLFGAGGHGKVVLDALLVQGERPLLLDEDVHKAGGTLLGCDIMLMPQLLTQLPPQGHIAIGDNSRREYLTHQLCAAGLRLRSVIHPAAVVAASGLIGDGCFIAAGAVIAPDTEIGEGTIVNHGAVVDHDCVVGAFSHIAPNVALGGGVGIGRCVLVGSGAVILPGLLIGDGATIGSGAVVTKDVREGATVVGAPAR